MDFEWDDEKRRKNIEKHGIDFVDVDLIFDGRHLIGQATTVDGESRELAVGTIDDVFVTVIFTRRGDSIRVISMRRSRHAERARYLQAFVGRSEAAS